MDLNNQQIIDEIKWLEEYKRKIELTYIINKQGKIIITYPKTDFNNDKNFSNRSWFKEVIKGKKYISNLIISEYNNHQVTIIAVPIKDKKGSIKGLVGVNLSLVELNKFIKNKLSKHDYLLLDRDNELLIASDKDILSVLNSNNLDFKKENFKMINKDRMITYYQLDNGWKLYFRNNYNQLFKSFYLLKDKFMIFLLFMFFIFLLWGIYIYNKFSYPVDQLIYQAIELSKGDYTKLSKTYPGKLNELALAFNNAIDEIKVREEELEDTFFDSIDAILNLVQIKDSYTADHSKKVKGFAISIAENMGITNIKFIKKLSIAAAIHDIGKIGISEEILNKPDELTQKEYNQIKEHPVIGARALSSYKRLEDISNIIYHHHEAFNGTGYPDGIKGAEIPLESRIIAAADTLHAMIEDRPYRKSLDIDTIKQIFEKEKGEQFDPEVTEAVLEILKELN